MTRHYSPRDFFRNTPNALLARYFAAREVLQDFDFKAIKETKIEPLFEAWLAVPETQRASGLLLASAVAQRRRGRRCGGGRGH